MLAIFKTGGKQYSAKAGTILKVEKLNGVKGDKISFTNVLAVSDDKSNNFGNPILKDALVEAKIIEQIRDKKIIVFKKRKRQNYRHTQGHRQYLTVLRIETISYDGKKSTAPDTKKVQKVEKNKIEKKDQKKEGKVIEKKTTSKKTVNKSSPVKKKTVKKTVKKSTKSKEDQ